MINKSGFIMGENTIIHRQDHSLPLSVPSVWKSCSKAFNIFIYKELAERFLFIPLTQNDFPHQRDGTVIKYHIASLLPLFFYKIYLIIRNLCVKKCVFQYLLTL